MNLKELGFVKTSGLSYNRLKSLVNKEIPLFHMVHKSNVKGFLDSKQTLLTPLEAQSKSRLKSVEGSIGTARINIGSKPSKRIITPKGVVPITKVLDTMGRDSTKFYGGTLARAGLPKPHGDYSTANISTELASNTNVGKNATDISFYPEPLRGYGDVGLMSTEKSMGGLKHKLHSGEIMVSPSARIHKDMITGLKLPKATGTIVYDPQKVPRSLAKELKASGAIPLNARFKRRLKAYKKKDETIALTAQDHDQISVGNLGYPRITNLYPDFEARVSKVNKRYNLR